MVKRVATRRRMEWTLVFAAIAGVLNWVAGFGWHALSPGQAALWMVVINAVAGAAAAWRTRPVPPQVWTYLIASCAALLAAYGLHVNQGHVSLFTNAILAVLALITRDQVTPVENTRTAGEVSPADAL
jgi:O-antigen/teichoic acid export membrane protein